MSSMVHTLSHLVLGQKGGENRVQIIELLKDRPYNINQMAECLQLNYRTVKHHIDVLLDNELLTPSSSSGYGEVYFLSPELEQNFELFKSIASKLKNMKSSNTFFHDLFEQTGDAVMVFDGNGLVIFWNKSAERLFGYSDASLRGKSIPIFDDPGFLTTIMQNVAGKKDFNVLEIIAKDNAGKPIEVEVNVDGISDHQGNIIAYSMIARDIGVRKWNEERLRYLNVLLKSINDVNQMINRLSDVDDLLEKLTARLADTKMFMDIFIGFSPESGGGSIARSSHRGIHDVERWTKSLEDTGKGLDCVKSAVNSKKTAIFNGNGNKCAICLNDCVHEGHATVVIPMMYHGKLVGIFGVCLNPGHALYKEEVSLFEEVVMDITLAKVKLASSTQVAKDKNGISAALLAARSGAWDWNVKTGVLSWSGGVEMIFGYDKDEMEPTHDALLDRIHKDDRQMVADSISACMKGEKEYDIEYRIVWSDGSTHWIREAGDILRDNKGEPTRMLVVVSDISRRKELAEASH